MKKILSINLAALANKLLVQFHTSTLSLVENLGCEAMGLDQNTFEDYKKSVQEMQDFVNRSMKSAYTERLDELDHRRVDLMRCIIARCRASRSSNIDIVKAAAADLKRLIVDEYPLSTMSAASQEKSAVINGLLMDLEKLNPEMLKALGIDAMAEELKAANDAHGQAYLARNAEHHRRGIGVMKELRKESEELYHAIVLQITSIANLSDKMLAAIGDPSEREKAAAQRDLAETAIGRQNEHIKNYRAWYLKRDASADAETDDELTDPDETDGDTTNGDGNNNGGTHSGPTTPDDVTEVL